MGCPDTNWTPSHSLKQLLITPAPGSLLLENTLRVTIQKSSVCMGTSEESIKPPLTFFFFQIQYTYVFDAGNMRIVWHTLNPTWHITGVSIPTFGGMTTLLVRTLGKKNKKTTLFWTTRINIATFRPPDNLASPSAIASAWSVTLMLAGGS